MGKEAPTAEIKLERNSGRFMQDLGERKFADEGSEPTKRSGWSREPCPFALAPWKNKPNQHVIRVSVRIPAEEITGLDRAPL